MTDVIYVVLCVWENKRLRVDVSYFLTTNRKISFMCFCGQLVFKTCCFLNEQFILEDVFHTVQCAASFTAHNVYNLFFFYNTHCQIRAVLSGALTSEPEVFTAS